MCVRFSNSILATPSSVRRIGAHVGKLEYWSIDLDIGAISVSIMLWLGFLRILAFCRFLSYSLSLQPTYSRALRGCPSPLTLFYPMAYQLFIFNQSK